MDNNAQGKPVYILSEEAMTGLHRCSGALKLLSSIAGENSGKRAISINCEELTSTLALLSDTLDAAMEKVSYQRLSSL
jgi:hypothetical protein